MNKSCPESQMLSVYFDGEMPSPWKEKLEAHVSGCPDCRKRLETYRLISQTPAPDVPADASERVWQRLTEGATSGAGVADNEQPSRPEIRRRPIWRRRLSVPLPAIAAAAVLVIAFAFVLITRNTPATGDAPAVAAETGGIPVIAGDTESEIFPDLDMASVLQYLNDRDGGEVLIIRLPDSRDFLNYSEPAMIRSADYSPNVRGGRRP
jgi:anti-sigma factor RsiW